MPDEDKLRSLWNMVRGEFNKRGLRSRTIMELGELVKIPWFGSRRDDLIGEFVDMEWGTLVELRGFGRRKRDRLLLILQTGMKLDVAREFEKREAALDKLGQYPIQDIAPITKKCVLKRLKALDIGSVREVATLDEATYLNAPVETAKGLPSFRRLKEMIRLSPDLAVKKLENSNIVTLPLGTAKISGLSSFRVPVVQYLEHKANLTGDDRDLQVIVRRYGLSNEEQKTLEQLGVYYDVTRERIRQVESKNLIELRGLFQGDLQTVRKAHFRFDTDIVKAFEDLTEHLAKHRLVDLKSFCEELKEQYPGDDPQVLILLFEIAGFEVVTIGSQQIVVGKPIIGKALIASAEKIHEILGAGIELSFFDIYVKLNPRGRALIAKEDLRIFLSVLDNVGFRQSGDVEGYYLNNIVPSKADYIHALLEQMNESAHFQEITICVNKRYPKKPVNERTVSNILSTDKRFVPVGKTGKWGLAEWGICGKSVKELLIECMKMDSEPVRLSRLTEYVRERRTEIPKATVQTILYEKSSPFTALRGGVWCLSSDAWKYNKLKKVKYRRKQITTKKAVLEFFKQNGNEWAQPKILLDWAEQKHGLRRETVRNTLLNSGIAEYRHISQYREYRLLPGAGETGDGKKRTKFDEAESLLVTWLTKQAEGEETLLTARNYMMEQYGYDAPYFYSLERKSRKIEKWKRADGTVCLRLGNVSGNREVPAKNNTQKNSDNDQGKTQDWEEAIKDESVRRVFLYLSVHGSATEQEIINMLGGTRNYRRFKLNLESYQKLIPFSVWIDHSSGYTRIVCDRRGR